MVNKPDIEEVLLAIHEGKTYRQMAEIFEMKLTTFSDFLAMPEHSARVKEALETSANEYAERAEQVLKDAKSTMTEVQRARELAQHYRWMARCRAPKRYGDKIDVTTDGQAIVPISGMVIQAKEKHDGE